MINEMQCDWYMGSNDFYEGDQITVELIEKIKRSIIKNEDDGPYNIYAAYDDANWLQMLFRRDLVSIEIVCEPNHQYVYYDKKYEGQTGLELIEFDQSVCPRIEACEDMTLAANIFEKWALYGKLYPATWADLSAAPDFFDEYYPKGTPEPLCRLSIHGIGQSKSRTVVFLKKYFKDNDFNQTLKRLEQLPITLCVFDENNILSIEKELKKIGADYSKEEVSVEDYEKFCLDIKTWSCMMDYLHLRRI